MRRPIDRSPAIGLLIAAVAACGGGDDASGDNDGAVDDDGSPGDTTDLPTDGPPPDCGLIGDSGCGGGGGSGPTIGPCPSMPADNIFNTPIDQLPVHANSDAFIATIGGTTNLHLDMGTQTSQQAADYYGIPYNLVNGGSFTWPQVAFASTDPDMSWNPRPESDCAVGTSHTSRSRAPPPPRRRRSSRSRRALSSRAASTPRPITCPTATTIS